MTVTSRPTQHGVESRCGRYRRDWDLLALGALEADLQEEMSLHLRSCPSCQQSFLNSEQVAEAISTVCLDAVTPVVDALVAERASVAAPGPSSRFRLPNPPRFLPWVLVAASVLCVLFVGHERDGLVTELGALRNNELVAMHSELLKQNEQLTLFRSMLGPLCSRSVHQMELRSVHWTATRAIARAMWSNDSGLLFLAADLPRLPDDKSYQLWVLRRSAPEVTSAGLLTMDTGTRGVLYLAPGDALSQARGFALTDEPKGGSMSSRGTKLLVGLE